MKITHMALWTDRLEEMKAFYTTYFAGTSAEKYTNPNKEFESYFIRFEGDAALELMRSVRIRERAVGEHTGYCHIAFSVGSQNRVIEMTERLRKDGFRITGEPRTTGDGSFESVVADPDGNSVEISI